jgi:lipopolysaccharide cholinephosphotransferase
MKRFIKLILKKILKPVSRYYLFLKKLDKYQPSILSVLSISNPVIKCPPAHGTLRKIQLAKANVLFAFDRFCKENGLRYWLHAGTHLGAVRHGGFIPWDDDIDIAMMREDFDQLIKIVSGMPRNGKIQYHYWQKGILKIKYIENDFVLDAVDIFPFHQYYKRTNNVERDQLINLISKYINSNYYRKTIIGRREDNIFYNTAKEIKIVREIIMKNKDPTEDGDIFKIHYDKPIFRYEWIFPLSTMSFEGRELPVPNNSNNVLESLYGDFLMYPPDMYNKHGLISDDLKHNWRNYEKLDAFLSMDSNTIYKIMTGDGANVFK